MIRLRGNMTQYPPKPLTLYFALYMNTKSQLMSNVENEQRILGRAIQVLMDHAILYDTGEDEDTSASITLLPLSYEERQRYGALSIPYQLGIYFSVSPVLLSSDGSEAPPRSGCRI
ncbi:MAG: Pvc16 family protein [Clostridia bacterium]